MFVHKLEDMSGVMTKTLMSGLADIAKVGVGWQTDSEKDDERNNTNETQKGVRFRSTYEVRHKENEKA